MESDVGMIKTGTEEYYLQRKKPINK